MREIQFDPEGKCARATRRLQECLIEEGRRLSDSGQFEQALTTLFHAYSLRPGVSPVLHSIAEVYEAAGDQEAATACRRGVIPRHAEEGYFNSRSRSMKFVAARKASGCRYLKTHRPENVVLHTPRSNASPSSRPEFRAAKTESRGSFVNIMENGGFWFDGFNTVVMDRRDNILEEHTRGNPYLVADVLRHKPELKVDATVCFLDARSSSIYYHWMMDILPKIAILHAAGIDLNSIDYFVVGSGSTFQKATLQKLGISDDRVVDPAHDNLTRCQRLIVPYLKNDRGDRFYNGLGLGMACWLPAWLKSTFIEEPSIQADRIYISRAPDSGRSLLEEDGLVEELEKRGFRSVSLECMTVSEQARLMAGAAMVVAPHGAGLSNIAFCKPETIVIEIFGGYVVPCYWALSELSDLEYHAWFAQADDKPAALQSHPPGRASHMATRRTQNIRLDTRGLLSYIDKLLQPLSMAS